MKKGIVGFGLWMLSALVLAAGLDDVQIKTTQVGDGVYMLSGAGGNMAVSVGADGVLLVDDQFAPLAPKILAAIKALSDQPLRFVFNTHWHGDHRGANQEMAEAGGLIVTHDNVRRRMAAGGLLKAFGDVEEAPVTGAGLPVVTFDGSVRFHINGLDIHAWHVPTAHTDGDSIVEFVGANVIHMGDTYFNGLYPAIDWSSGGTVEGMIAACDLALLRMDAKTKVIPGHGPLSNPKELRVYRAMLADVLEKVRALRAKGKSLAEIQAAKPSAAYDAKWGGGFLPPDTWIAMVVHAIEHADAKR